MAFTTTIIERVVSDGNVSVLSCLFETWSQHRLNWMMIFVVFLSETIHRNWNSSAAASLRIHPFYFKFITPPTTGIRTVSATVSVIK